MRVTESTYWERETWLHIFEDYDVYMTDITQEYILEPTVFQEGGVVRVIPGRDSTYWYSGTHYYTDFSAWENQWNDWSLVESKSFLGFTYYEREQMLTERTASIMRIHNHNIKASHPIAIEFIGNDEGELWIQSRGDIVINGTISNTDGYTNITSAYGTVRMGDSERAQIIAHDITMWANTGLGQESQPVLINQVSGEVNASTNAGDLYLQVLQGDMTAHQVLAVHGDLYLTVDGSIRPVNEDSLLYGTKINLVSLHGAIADEDLFFTIDTAGNEHGDLTATAENGIYLAERAGDLYINQVVSHSGDVQLVTNDGDLIDNNRNQIKDIRAEQGLLSLLWEEMELMGERAAENAERTVRAYEQTKQSEYLIYWQYRMRQVAPEGKPLPADHYYPGAVIKLTADEVSYYMNELGWTAEQVAKREAEMTAAYHQLHQTYGAYGDTFNPHWSYVVERPMINGQTVYDPRLYDPTVYSEWDSLINGHAWTQAQLTNVIGSLKEVTDTRIWIEEPNIIGRNISLWIAGSIGSKTSFSVPAFQQVGKPPAWSWYSLTPEQQLQYLAAERDDVTFGFNTMTVTVRESIDIQATGSVIARSYTGDIYLASEGDINLDFASAQGAVRIKTAGSIYNAFVRGTNVVLEAAQGRIGTAAEPLRLASGTESLTARAAGGVYIAATGDLYVDTVYSPGVVQLTTSGGIYGYVGTGYFSRSDLNIRARSLWLEAETHIGGTDADTALKIGMDAAGTLTAHAGGRINIASPTLDIITGQIEAGEDITLTSGGNIIVLSGTLLTPLWVPPVIPPIDLPPIPELLDRHVVSTGGRVTFSAGGSILDGDSSEESGISGHGITLLAGGTVGTAENPLELHLAAQTSQNVLVAKAAGDIAVTAVNGRLQVSEALSTLGSVYLTATVGAISLGVVNAANGQAVLHAAEAITGGPVVGPHIQAQRITLQADADRIGGTLGSLRVAGSGSQAVTVAASGTVVNLYAMTGDLVVERIAATLGDVNLSAAGAIIGVADATGPHITSGLLGALTLSAAEGIGIENQPLTYNSLGNAGVTASAEMDIYLTRLGGDMLVNEVASGGKYLVLQAPEGGIHGGVVSGAWVTLQAQGDVGGQNPLIVRATEELSAVIGGSAHIIAPEDDGFLLGDLHIGDNLQLAGKEIALAGAINALGNICLAAWNSITAEAADHIINGRVIELQAVTGGIGAPGNPIVVGDHLALNVDAYSHIFLEVRGKSMVSDYVRSQIGKVSLNVQNGHATIGKKTIKSLVSSAEDELWGVYAVDLIVVLPTAGGTLSIGQAAVSGNLQLNADFIEVTDLTHTGGDPLQVSLGGGSQGLIEQLIFSGGSSAGIVFNDLAGEQVSINVNTPQLQLVNALITDRGQINTQTVRVSVDGSGTGGGSSDVVLLGGSSPFDLIIGQTTDILTTAEATFIGAGFTVNGQEGAVPRLELWLQPLFGGYVGVLAWRTDSGVVVIGGLVNMDLEAEEDDAEEEEDEEDAEAAGAPKIYFSFIGAPPLLQGG
ncbi:MAG TPA: hypothetical protein GXZ82_04435 [Firmicutes bacterium]|nr:hypothetical protein [Bacillota bacterium]